MSGFILADFSPPALAHAGVLSLVQRRVGFTPADERRRRNRGYSDCLVQGPRGDKVYLVADADAAAHGLGKTPPRAGLSILRRAAWHGRGFGRAERTWKDPPWVSYIVGLDFGRFARWSITSGQERRGRLKQTDTEIIEFSPLDQLAQVITVVEQNLPVWLETTGSR